MRNAFRLCVIGSAFTAAEGAKMKNILVALFVTGSMVLSPLALADKKPKAVILIDGKPADVKKLSHEDLMALVAILEKLDRK